MKKPRHDKKSAKIAAQVRSERKAHKSKGRTLLEAME